MDRSKEKVGNCTYENSFSPHLLGNRKVGAAEGSRGATWMCVLGGATWMCVFGGCHPDVCFWFLLTTYYTYNTCWRLDPLLSTSGPDPPRVNHAGPTRAGGKPYTNHTRTIHEPYTIQSQGRRGISGGLAPAGRLLHLSMFRASRQTATVPLRC